MGKTQIHLQHESKLEDIYYNYIKNKVKIYEMRVNDDKRQQMLENDIWLFSNKNDPTKQIIKTKIIERKDYKSFEEAINDIGYKNLLPQSTSIDDAITTYEGFR